MKSAGTEIIETERLILRKFSFDDCSDMLKPILRIIPQDLLCLWILTVCSFQMNHLGFLR